MKKTTKDSEVHFKSICDAAHDGIVAADEDGNIIFVNQAIEAIFGHAPQDIIGQPLTVLLSPRLHATYSQAIAGFLANGESHIIGKTIELSGRKIDGLEFPLELSLGAAKDGEKVVFTGILRDITERKKVDYEAVQLADMIARGSSAHKKNEDIVRRKNLELETLLYVTSHDLKEPLRAIANFSRILDDRYADRLDEKGQDFLHRILTAASRMSQLLDDILDLCRAGQMEVPAVDIEAEKIVRLILNRLEIKIKESSAKIEIVRPLPKLRVNSLWASQAIYNLVLNALKFTSEGQPPDLEIAPYLTPKQVGIIVRDRGPGVPPEQRERIFQLFQRAVGREIEGTGAGLAIVRQIAGGHYGEAWVQPRDGGGSEFIITFGPPPREESKADEH